MCDVFGDHVANVVDTRGDDVCCLQDICKHWTPHLRIKGSHDIIVTSQLNYDIILTSSNVPENESAGGLGLIRGLRGGSGSMLCHASLWAVYCRGFN